MKGAALLARYLKTKQLKQSAFADANGFSKPLVSMWLSRQRVPGRENSLKLAEVTSGQVPASSWQGQRVHQASLKRSSAARQRREVATRAAPVGQTLGRFSRSHPRSMKRPAA